MCAVVGAEGGDAVGHEGVGEVGGRETGGWDVGCCWEDVGVGKGVCCEILHQIGEGDVAWLDRCPAVIVMAVWCIGIVMIG